MLTAFGIICSLIGAFVGFVLGVVITDALAERRIKAVQDEADLYRRSYERATQDFTPIDYYDF